MTKLIIDAQDAPENTMTWWLPSPHLNQDTFPDFCAEEGQCAMIYRTKDQPWCHAVVPMQIGG